MNRRSLAEWASIYVGDPASWSRRGLLIRELLIENGLTPDSSVLNIGCGNLSEGLPILRHLHDNRFVGIEPNGWLVEVAMQENADVEGRGADFLYRTDFDASELGRKFDFVVSHSVLSHCAHWQLAQMLANTRRVVDEGAVQLCSFIHDQYNSFDADWVYPGVSKFRIATVIAAGIHTGWRVELMHGYRDRMIEVAPNDTHDWLRLTAVPSMSDLNQMRLDEEARLEEERVLIREAEQARVVRLAEMEKERMREAGIE